MNRDVNKPGPGSYKDAKHLNTIGKETRFSSAMKTAQSNSFSKSERFHTPTWKKIRAPDAKYNVDLAWTKSDVQSKMYSTGFTIFGKDQTD